MTREELVKSREYWLTKIRLSVYELIENYRASHNLTKTQLAEKLGVSKGYITQILNGDFDHKVSKLVDLALAFDMVPDLVFKNTDDFLANEIRQGADDTYVKVKQGVADFMVAEPNPDSLKKSAKRKVPAKNATKKVASKS